MVITNGVQLGVQTVLCAPPDQVATPSFLKPKLVALRCDFK